MAWPLSGTVQLVVAGCGVPAGPQDRASRIVRAQ